VNTAPAIRARGLRKVFRIYAGPLAPIVEALSRRTRHMERVALDGVDLDLQRGEIVGILGRNGAGKSTLLKIIAGTLEKTTGELEVSGRITAMLELGTGFHPEYSGRENIYMGGLCLGMSRDEIDAKLDTIIDFSELREVIDQPFKTYSTGMQARLTFSTAISVDPDILIVDEALSVGDARFQMKCFAWFQRLRDKRATVLMVSHDTNTITTFCDRALILEGGRVHAKGDAKQMTVAYHNMLFGERSQPSRANQWDPELTGGSEEEDRADHDAEVAVLAASGAAGKDALVRYGTGEAELIDWGLFDERGRRLAVVESGARCRLSMRIAVRDNIDDLSVGFAIKDRRGTVLWGTTNLTHFRVAHRASAGDMLAVSAPCTMWLAAGDYFVTLGAAHLNGGGKIDFVEDAIEFRVTGPGTIFTTAVVNLDSSLTIESVRPVRFRSNGCPARLTEVRNV
jgi:homopolymeric O-antigen transport system ATP-binding protein